MLSDTTLKQSVFRWPIECVMSVKCSWSWTLFNSWSGIAIEIAFDINLLDDAHVFNKELPEPRVSPAFAITYFCNHCNIRFENTSKYVDTLTLYSKNLNQRSLTPRWPLPPCLLRSHVWLYPRIIVSKSHDNTSMYVDTVINFAKYHIHTITTYILHTTYILRTYYVQNEWSHSLLLNSVQARQKWKCAKAMKKGFATESVFSFNFTANLRSYREQSNAEYSP